MPDEIRACPALDAAGATVTTDQIREALTLCEAASKGPWLVDEDPENLAVYSPERFVLFTASAYVDLAETTATPYTVQEALANLRLAVSARTHYAEVLQELLEARAEIASYKLCSDNLVAEVNARGTRMVDLEVELGKARAWIAELEPALEQARADVRRHARV